MIEFRPYIFAIFSLRLVVSGGSPTAEMVRYPHFPPILSSTHSVFVNSCSAHPPGSPHFCYFDDDNISSTSKNMASCDRAPPHFLILPPLIDEDIVAHQVGAGQRVLGATPKKDCDMDCTTTTVFATEWLDTQSTWTSYKYCLAQVLHGLYDIYNKFYSMALNGRELLATMRSRAYNAFIVVCNLYVPLSGLTHFSAVGRCFIMLVPVVPSGWVIKPTILTLTPCSMKTFAIHAIILTLPMSPVRSFELSNREIKNASTDNKNEDALVDSITLDHHELFDDGLINNAANQIKPQILVEDVAIIKGAIGHAELEVVDDAMKSSVKSPQPPKPTRKSTKTAKTKPKRKSTKTAKPTSPPISIDIVPPTNVPTPKSTSQLPPTGGLSSDPSSSPSVEPSKDPSFNPSMLPSHTPSLNPSDQPSITLTSNPSVRPSLNSSPLPSNNPSTEPSEHLSRIPSTGPSKHTSNKPSKNPSQHPSDKRSLDPSMEPSSNPSGSPSKQSSKNPSGTPSKYPSFKPSGRPSLSPSNTPSKYCFKSKADLQLAVNAYINGGCSTTSDCSTRLKYGEIGTWCTTGVSDMSGLFESKSWFNDDISGWDVSSVIDMRNMFKGATYFNQPLNEWNVGAVRDMRGMFLGANSFNQPLYEWNVASVTDMTDMFQWAQHFNQPLGEWNITAVTAMSRMFNYASRFNQNLCPWGLFPSFPYSFAGAMFLGSGCLYNASPNSVAKGPFCASDCT